MNPIDNEILEAKLVKTERTVRFYKLSKKINKFPYKGLIYKNEIEYLRNRIKSEYKKFIKEIEEGTDIICISDVHTHTERLVFTGMAFINSEGNLDYGRFVIQADDKHTFMTKGGDSNSVYADEVYLRRIASVNKLTLKMI